MPPVRRASGRRADETRSEIEDFIKNSRQPALLEPGEELLPLTPGQFALDIRGERLTLQVWDRTRNLVRRVTAIKESTASRMEIAVERFPRRQGHIYLLDLSRRAGADLGRRSGKLVFRERFRLFLRRQFPNGLWPNSARKPTLSSVCRPLSRGRSCGMDSMGGPPSPARLGATPQRYLPSG